jgi:hypothetical protein
MTCPFRGYYDQERALAGGVKGVDGLLVLTYGVWIVEMVVGRELKVTRMGYWSLTGLCVRRIPAVQLLLFGAVVLPNQHEHEERQTC